MPKKGAVFAFKVGGHVATLYGSQICYRSAERAVRKFKPKPTVDL